MSGIHSRIRPGFRSTGQTPAVFLDRDGVVIEETGYLCRVEDIRFLGGALESVLALNQAGIPVVLATNQAGVGRGYYAWSEFEAVQDALETKLKQSGAWLDAVWACAYHPDAIAPYRAFDHTHRKPNPGMLLDAARQMGLDLSESWMVGDRPCDVEAGLNAGVGTAVHVETGYGKEFRGEAEEKFRGNSRVRFCKDLSEATSFILRAVLRG